VKLELFPVDRMLRIDGQTSGTLRCVERCCPSAAQARRSETCSCARTCSMQARRRAGLNALHCPAVGMDLALAAKMSELFWSLDKPSLATLPFFVGC
jgi:hypothetical protein